MAATIQSSPLILRLISSSVTIANRAGRIIRDVMSKGELDVVQKTGKNDLQTKADRSAQQCIITSIIHNFPAVKVIGEEEDEGNTEVPPDWLVSDFDPQVLKMDCPDELKKVTEEEVVVWVDPLDGTSEYTQGLLDHVTVLIGVAIGDKAVGGVIHQPYYNYQIGTSDLGRTIWGIQGVGVGGITKTPPPKGRIITTTRSHSNTVQEAAIKALQPDEVLRVGGAGHKVLLLLEGKANAYVFASVGCKKWDTCAPEAILHTLGGKLTDIHGKVYQYHADVKQKNLGGVLATAQESDHSWYLSRMPKEVKDVLASYEMAH